MENDYELLYLAKENNEEAVKILYKKYYNLLHIKAEKYHKFPKINKEDLFNEAILAFYSAIDSYEDDTKFITYLNVCIDSALTNYCKSHNRYKNKVLNESKSLFEENLSALEDNKLNPENIIMEETEYQILKEKIISALTWKEELIFVLKVQNYTTKEIAEITDNNLKSIYNIIKRIRNKILNIVSN